MQGNVATPMPPPGTTPSTCRRKFLDMSDTQTFAASLTMPAQIVLLLIMIFPLLAEVYISLTSWTPTVLAVTGPRPTNSGTGTQLRGAVRDVAFWQALGRTFLIVGIAVALEFLLGLARPSSSWKTFRANGFSTR